MPLGNVVSMLAVAVGGVTPDLSQTATLGQGGRPFWIQNACTCSSKMRPPLSAYCRMFVERGVAGRGLGDPPSQFKIRMSYPASFA